MTHRNEKTLAALFCAASALSFAAFPDAEAAPVFPPPHTANVFANDARAPATSTAAATGPWYRPAPDAVTRLRLDGIPVASVASTWTVTPWYRAAN